MEQNKNTIFGLKYDIGIVILLFLASLLSWFFDIHRLIADDSYFYLVIARNIVQHGSHTFSGFIATNGFHPLWGYLLTGYTAVANALNPELLQSVYYALPLQIFLLAVIVVFFWKFAKTLNLSPLLFVVIPIFFVTQFTNIYSELPLSLAMTAVTCWYYAKIHAEKRRNAKTMSCFGILCGFLMLSRLDLFFLVAIFYIFDLCYHRDRYTFVSGLAASICVLPYLIINKIYFGGFVPISGTMKSVIPDIGFREGLVNQWPRLTCRGCSIPFGILPIIAGGLALLILRKQKNIMFYLAIFWISTVLLFAYLSMCTAPYAFTYRPWYYGPHITLLSISIAAALPAIFKKRLKWAFGSVVALLFIITFFSFFTLRDNTQLELSKTYNDAISKCPPNSTILVSDYPGIMAFTSPDKHIITSDMLMCSKKFYQRMMQSGNALKFWFQYSRKENHPIDFIFCMPTGPLRYNHKERVIVYYDPKMKNHRKEIGRIPVTTTPIRPTYGWLVPVGNMSREE